MLKCTLHLAVCLLFGLISPAAAQTYYVAPLGAKVDPAPDGSLAKPFPSLAAALKSGKVDGGETLLLMDGNHGPITLANVAMATPLTIRSQNPQKAHSDYVVVNGTSKNLVLQNLSVWPRTPDLSYKHLVSLTSSASNITIEGFLIRRDPDAQNYLSWDLTTWNARKPTGIRADASNSIIRGNTLVATYMGIVATGSNVLVEQNLVDGFNGDGMRGLGPNDVFRRNRVVNCFKTDANHVDGFQAWVNSTANPTGLVLDGNIIHEWIAQPKDHPLRCMLQGIGMFDGIYKNLTIVNNIVSSTQYHGISVYGADKVLIANNTVVHSSGNPATSPSIRLRASKGGVEPTNALVINNVAMRILGTPDTARNVVFKNNSTLTYPAKMLKDVLAFDYHPKADSGFIDTGDRTSAPKLDVVGTARPLGAGVDRGAYEGSSGAVAPVIGTLAPTSTTEPLSTTNTTAKFVTAP